MFLPNLGQTYDFWGIVNDIYKGISHILHPTDRPNSPEVFTLQNMGVTHKINITAENVDSDPYTVYSKVGIDFNNYGNFEELTTHIDQGMMQFSMVLMYSARNSQYQPVYILVM